MYILILKIAAVLLFGFIGGKVASKFKLPEVSGYLLFGILLGPSLGLIIPDFAGIVTTSDQEELKFIGDIALSFIAFSIGSEFNLKSINKTGKAVNIITVFEVLFAVSFVFIALLFVPKTSEITNGYAPFSKNNIAFGLILASMSAATAPAATLMVIRQYRAHGPLTRTILPVTALDDIYGIVIFGFFISIAQILTSSTSGMPLWLMILKPLIEVFGSILIGMIIGAITSFINGKFAKNRDHRQVLSVLAVLFSIGIIWLLNSGLESFGIGFSPLLVSIMIGTMIANLAKKPQDTFSSINDLATPFYVLFFTIAGASLDLNILKTSGLVVLLSIVFILARGFGKISGASVGAIIAKSESTVKKYLGFALLPQDRGKQDVLLRHLNGRCALLDGDYYRDNPFFKTINISELSIGKWRLAFDRYEPYQAFAFRDIDVSSQGYEEKTHLGFFEEPFSFPVIMQEDRVWMSVTPHEIETMRQAVIEARGVVAVMGLGLGYYPYMIAQKEAVKKVIVFEKDAEAISLFSQYLLPQFPNREKITIVEADAVKDFAKFVQQAYPDYVFSDVWQGVDDGLPLFVEMKKEEKRFPGARFRYWIEKSLLAMVRRIIITIFEEAIEGFTSEDYENADTPLDVIFRDLFNKLGNAKFSSFDDILNVLTDEGISALLSR